MNAVSKADMSLSSRHLQSNGPLLVLLSYGEIRTIAKFRSTSLGEGSLYMYVYMYMWCVCLCVCVHVKERDRDGDRERNRERRRDSERGGESDSLTSLRSAVATSADELDSPAQLMCQHSDSSYFSFG